MRMNAAAASFLMCVFFRTHISAAFRQMDCYCGTAKVGVRIVGGKEAAAHRYPWMTTLATTSDMSPFCGGALISDRYILTAAHCLSQFSVNETSIILGHHSVKDLSGTTILKADKFIIHPNYDADDADQKFDIGLIRLGDRVMFTREISPICLPTRVTPGQDFKSLIVAGWGLTRRSGDPSETLQEAIIPEVPLEKCLNLHHRGRITPSHICAGNRTVDTCDGDSGGPLMTNWVGRMHAVGIVSWGIACAHSYYPAVFTRVYSYANWISISTPDAKYCNNQTFDPENWRSNGK